MHTWTGKLLVWSVLMALPLGAHSGQRGEPRQPAQEAPRFEILPVKGQVSLIYTPEANVIVQSGQEGIVVVDTGPEARSQQTLEQIRNVSKERILYVVNTDLDPQLTGGNVAVSYAGFSFSSGPNAPSLNNAPIYAHENVLIRMSGRDSAAGARPSQAWPSDTFFTGSLEIHLNDEPIEIIHVPNAITDGSSIVFFRRSDVIAAGGVYRTDSYPVIDVEKGGTIDGVVDALNKLVDLAIPKVNQEGGTLIVPSQGRISDEYDLVTYRDMVTIIRDRVRQMVQEGRTLEEVLARGLSADYDVRYGRAPGRTRTFIESIYKTVDPKRNGAT